MSNLIESTIAAIPDLHNDHIRSAVEQRWNSLTKPRGSLGRLERLVCQVALIQGNATPRVENTGIYVFCGDHGITAEGVSAYPQEVTRQMMLNFTRGGAAINVLCWRFGIETVTVDAGTAGELVPGVIDRRIGPGTTSFLNTPAMSHDQAVAAIESGIRLAAEAAVRFEIVGLGEMGIGNSTAASALLCAFAGIDPERTAGYGAGLDEAGLQRKIDVLRRAIAHHRPDPSNPVAVLAALGGFEIAMMAGFLLGAASRRLPVVLDGFITGGALLVAHALFPKITEYVFFSHQSAERGHALLFQHVGAEPILSLDMRLGEGSGAAMALHLIGTAIDLYRHMATFEQAAVSDKS